MVAAMVERTMSMTDYRLLFTLLLQDYSYRQIAMMAGCSNRAITRARKILDQEKLTELWKVKALTEEDLDRLFYDGRKIVSSEFVAVDVDRAVNARLGKHKPPLKVLWAQYLESPASPGTRFYGYDRFCEIIAEHVRTHDLTAPITHLPGHTMQVDWAGTRMELTDPITRIVTKVSIFVATLPYSGLVFAYGSVDEKMPAWLQAHQHAFEYFGGIPMIVVPDNASTASNQITQTSRAREVNSTYSEFLEYHNTAAVPTRAGRPQDKGNVEAGVKIVTHWIIHYLAGRVFITVDDLNAAIGERLEFINSRVPFRGEPRSRQDWFDTHERSELMALPQVRWEPVIWRKAKVHRDWHIQIDTIKCSVPATYAGLKVDVRIIGTSVDVLHSDRIIASHHKGRLRNSYVTSLEHAPPGHGDGADLWTRSYG